MMTAVKTKYRSSITDDHLGHCLRLALTPKKPNFKKLASELQGHSSKHTDSLNNQFKSVYTQEDINDMPIFGEGFPSMPNITVSSDGIEKS